MREALEPAWNRIVDIRVKSRSYKIPQKNEGKKLFSLSSPNNQFNQYKKNTFLIIIIYFCCCC